MGEYEGKSYDESSESDNGSGSDSGSESESESGSEGSVMETSLNEQRQILVEAFDSDQLARYETHRRANLNASSVRKLLTAVAAAASIDHHQQEEGPSSTASGGGAVAPIIDEEVALNEQEGEVSLLKDRIFAKLRDGSSGGSSGGSCSGSCSGSSRFQWFLADSKWAQLLNMLSPPVGVG
ncbi:hypothetical protein CANINC_002708 [Pichia inconspicua]|uniref:TAFII28-like protein domain-containing protein n=1 Tax=Pichia inconspicua TaxID=52247 RepID=A0A4T0X0U8_9ASCO|nr:hypothetical protein CANINC_002708 [[Candida] inconspicua]